MFKVLVIKSKNSQVPLAEVRTDGNVIDFTVDNTGGDLPEKFKNSYSEMIKFIKKSSHLYIEEQKKPTASFLRYLLDNGDVVEITTDGKTCVLNGEILTAEEKQKLFEAIKNGEVRVTKKTDIENPIPVPSITVKEIEPKIKVEQDPARIQLINNFNKMKMDLNANNSSSYDFEIENNIKELKNSENSDYIKKTLYFLKYGD